MGREGEAPPVDRPMAAPTMVAVFKMAAAVNCCTGLNLGGNSKENLLRAIRGEGVVFIASASMSTTSWRLARASFTTFFVEVVVAFLVLVGGFVGALAAVAFAEDFLATAAFLATAIFLATPPFQWASFFWRGS
jgi:hypothetical protein